MPTLRELAVVGQSVWIDTLSRSMLTSGELAGLIDQGARGVTDNPTILDKAITGSADYDDDIRRMARLGKSPEAIYEVLAIDDVGRAADLLRPVYNLLDATDGFVSLEVNPHKDYDTAASIAEVRRFAAILNRPNVLFKVPATDQGIPAIEQLISEGINENITLMFSLAQYQAVAEAYLNGLERLQRAGGDITRVASVASFFVSRVDTAVDHKLQTIGAMDLQGHIAIANAKMAYVRFRAIMGTQRWQALARAGARPQRPLWASTGTKNPRYPDSHYADNLIGPSTVNTMPLATLQAFLDHGVIAPRVEMGWDEAQYQLARLADLGIELDIITEQLTEDGVNIFAESYDHLLGKITEKVQTARQQRAA